MNKEYLHQFEDNQIERRLLSLENIPKVEGILEGKIKKLILFEKKYLSGDVDIGDYLSVDKVIDMAPSIYRKVDNYLGVRDITNPILSFENVNILDLGLLFLPKVLPKVLVKKPTNDLYYPALKRIVLIPCRRKYESVGALVHEYTHHIQNEIFPKPFFRKNGIFKEGHATGTTRQILERYSKEKDSEIFSDTIAYDVICLRRSYLWMCKKLGQKPNEELLKSKSPLKYIENVHYNKLEKPSIHEIGNTAFLIYEQLYGKDIYRQIIKGEF